MDDKSDNESEAINDPVEPATAHDIELESNSPGSEHTTGEDTIPSDGQPSEGLRRSARNKTNIAKRNAAIQLHLALSKEIISAQQTLDDIYTNFETLESLDSTLTDISELATHVNGIFDELVIACDNKLEQTTMKQFDDFMKEVELLKQTVQHRIESSSQEEEEMNEMEKTMARLKAELEEQNRIYEERKAERTAIRERAMRKSKENFRSVNSVLNAATATPQTPLYSLGQRAMSRTMSSEPLQTESPVSRQVNTDNNHKRIDQMNTPQYTHPRTIISPQESTLISGGPMDGMSVVRELSQNIVAAMKSSKRSSPEPAIYDGNPINFQDWELDFDAYIESEGLCGIEPLRYLKKFTKSKAKDAISGHFITNTETAYRDARRELKMRFGSKHNVNRALRKRLDDWPRIGGSNTSSLRSYADFLTHVKSAMNDNPELQSLNHSQENEKLAAKLPDFMIRSWARKVKEKRAAELRYPTYDEFVYFVVDQAEVMDEPLMKGISINKEHSGPSKKTKETHSPNVRTFATSSASPSPSVGPCKYCAKAHLTVECFSLTKLTHSEKEEFIKANRLCYGCLNTGHLSRECSRKATCKKCNRRHPTALHQEPGNWRAKTARDPQTTVETIKTETQQAASLPNEQKPQAESKKLEVKATKVSGQALSMVIPVHISSKEDPSRETLVYAMLDTASNASYITNEAAKAIQPTFTMEKVTVNTLTGESTGSLKLYNRLQIRGYNKVDYTTIKAFEWNNLTSDTHVTPNCINVCQFPHLRNYAHHLPPPLDIPIGLLIGTDCPEAFAPLESVSGERGEPFAQRTMLGWTVLGGRVQSPNHEDSTENAVQVHSTTLNEADEQTMISQEDLKFLEIMDKKTHRNQNGSLEMPLPFKDRPHLPNNKIQAEKRLVGLKRELDSDEAFRKEYYTFMDELLHKGHAEPIDEQPNDGEQWYIPHFAVKHPKKEKIRVVFDCSAVFKGLSLNDHLLQGPDLTNNMVGILLRFRKEYVAMACDVEKMFYNFHVNKEDRDYLRFLWYGKSGEIKTYRMTVHLFGATSSPAVATYGLRKLADYQRSLYPLAAKFIERNFYVDDGITSTETVAEAVELVESSRKLCKEGNLRLHKFISNNPTVLDRIPDTEKSTKYIDLLNQPSETQRTLGLEWSIKEDLLKFSNTGFNPNPPTRRGILSTVSQLYDPLGLLAPFTLNGKNILKDINQANHEWDKEIGSEMMTRWAEWTKELENLENVRVTRCIKPSGFGDVKTVELHHFSDASMSGMGACSYIRLVNKHDQVHTSLLIAKSRVVPSKGIATIPRLELQSAVMATQLSCILKSELDMVIDQEYFWSDSEIALAYLANEKTKFHVYVANRVRQILSTTDIGQWNHISGSENPADIASRGMSVSQLKDSVWFTGPLFLQSKSFQDKLSSAKKANRDLSAADPEVKRVKEVKVTSMSTQNKLSDPDANRKHIILELTSPLRKLTEHFSNKGKLVRVVAQLRAMAKHKVWKLHTMNALDLDEAEKQIIKATQEEHFSAEVKSLDSDKTVKRTSRISALNPFKDQDGILRVGGRAARSTTLSYDEKHSVILPKGSPLAKLIILDVHQKKHHLGRSYTAAAVREAGFWIISGPKMIKSVVEKCVICRRLRGHPVDQMMGELPVERLGKHTPFTYSGMDCFGPFPVKERRTELKKYGLVFTCLYTRGIHIELLDDLSTDAFLNALRCFMSLRGPIKSLHCDHGTNFVGAKNELNKQFVTMIENEAKHYLADKRIMFHMTSPTASHQGGIWERQIRTIRAVLSEIFLQVKGRFDTSMLRTAFCEVMATVNSRPITLVDINNPEETPLTPNALLTGKLESTPPPPGDFSDDRYAKARWRQVQNLANEFWVKWKTSYGQDITKRQKWRQPRENIKAGDIVLVVDSDVPRNMWKRGVVEETHPGKDGLVRNVTVKISTKFLDMEGKPLEKQSMLQRPVQKLVKLI